MDTREFVDTLAVATPACKMTGVLVVSLVL